jgi:hypothetical protein
MHKFHRLYPMKINKRKFKLWQNGTKLGRDDSMVEKILTWKKNEVVPRVEGLIGSLEKGGER